MAVNIRTRVFAKARGLSWPVPHANTPIKSIQDNTPVTLGAKRSLEQIDGGTYMKRERSGESQSSPFKRKRLETALPAHSSTPASYHDKSYLTSLPNELFFSIIEELDNPVDFACLASICQQAYTTVRQNHPEKLQLDKYQKIKYALREELNGSNSNKRSGQSEIWHRAHNEVDLDFPYSDLILSWCDAWRVTHHHLSVYELVPQKIMQHMRMDGKGQKIEWEEDWQAQCTRNGRILLHCTRTYPNIRFSNGQIMVNGAPRDDGLFKMCNHIPSSYHGALGDDDRVWSHLSINNIYALSCTLCNTDLKMEKVERSPAYGVTVWDLKVRTFHDLGRFEIDECDSRSWLKWLGRQPNQDNQNTGLRSGGEEDRITAIRRYGPSAWSAWKITLKESGLKKKQEEKERTKIFV